MEANTTTTSTDAPTDAPSTDQASVRSQYRDWPFGPDDDRPQPWEHRALNVDPNAVGPGEHDDASPVPIEHNYPTLSAGSHGPAVLELGQLLGDLGYGNSVSEGNNPFNVLDDGLLRAVQQFRRDHGVVEDPTAFGGDNDDGRRAAGNHVGPYTWEALQRVTERDDQ